MRLCKAIALLSVLLLVFPAIAADRIENFCPKESAPLVPQLKVAAEDETTAGTALNPDSYWDGTLRVYVVEHVSSMGWNSGGEPYHFPFLAFALDAVPISMIGAIWDTTVTWDGNDFGYDNLQEDNIAVQAVLFSQADGLPGAAAMADPGVPGTNVSGGGYTHTVFVEEGSATW
ncbi:MAG: hypothetical protein ABIJ61_09610 [bacterium]